MPYNDYPQSAVNNAKRAIKHKEENGSSCGTRVGWLRANQISKKENLSVDTIKRVFSFLSRAKTYDQGKYTDENGKEICGSIMYDAWGGDSMKTWAERKLNSLSDKERNMELNLNTTLNERHIKDVVETEDSYIIEFSKPHEESDGYEDSDGDNDQDVVGQIDDAGYKKPKPMREIKGSSIQRSAITVGGNRRVSGYGIVFNSDSLPLVIHDRSNGFVKVYERITRDSIEEADMTDVIAAFNHNFEKLMGRTTSNTLQLSIDDKGVFYSFEAPPTQAGDDLLTHLQRKEISGSSFTFTIDAEEGYDIIERGDGSLEATPKRITKIYEMGPVINPAYPMTTAENRSQGLFDAVTSHLNRKVEEEPKQEERKQDDAEMLKAKAELELFVIENI